MVITMLKPLFFQEILIKYVLNRAAVGSHLIFDVMIGNRESLEDG